MRKLKKAKAKEKKVNKMINLNSLLFPKLYRKLSWFIFLEFENWDQNHLTVTFSEG